MPLRELIRLAKLGQAVEEGNVPASLPFFLLLVRSLNFPLPASDLPYTDTISTRLQTCGTLYKKKDGTSCDIR